MSHLAALSLVFAATKKTTSSSGAEFFLILIVGFGALWYFFLRPQQAKARKARDDARAFEVGDEIVTVGGIVGRVLDVEGDRVTVLTGEGGPDGTVPTRLVMVRQAIARKAEPVTPAAADEYDEDEVEDEVDEAPHEEPEPPPPAAPPATERPSDGEPGTQGRSRWRGRKGDTP